MAGPADDLVGPFHRLDRDHRLVLDRDRLPDVERGDGVRHAVAEGEVLALLLARRALGQHALARQQRLEKRRRVEQLDALVAHDLGDGRNQRVGVAGLEAGEHGQQRQVRHDAGEDLDVLDLAGHHRAGHAGRP